MRIRLAPHAVAGWLLFVPAAAILSIWYAYLFVAMPDNLGVWEAAVGQLQYTFSEANPRAWWFVWLLALPALCVALALAYLLNAAHTRNARVILLCAVLGLAVAAVFLNGLAIAMFIAVPALWGYRAIHAT